MKLLHPFVPERLAGSVLAVQGAEATVSLPWAGLAPVSLFGQSVLRGEVGEFLLFACGPVGVFGRLVSLEAPRAKRPEASTTPDAGTAKDVVGTVQLLGTLHLDGAFVRGVERHPRVGDLVYAADADAIRAVLSSGVRAEGALLRLGALRGTQTVEVDIPASTLFGRHLAIVGSTGGGKSWTLESIIESAAAQGVRVLLLDATGEFGPIGDLADHLVVSPRAPSNGTQVCLPHRQLSESDRRALLRPAGGSQLPKLRAAIRSLRLAHVLGRENDLVNEQGLLPKANRPKQPYTTAVYEHASEIEQAHAPFELRNLADQVSQECVYEVGQGNASANFGGWSSSELSYCNTLIARIHDLTTTTEVMDVLDPQVDPPTSVLDAIDSWTATGTRNVLRVSLSDLTFEHNMREIVVNTIGRHLLARARSNSFRNRPLVVAIDEAHQFFGRTITDDQVAAAFDSFDLVAKEGRKYGLVVCMATQRPGDLPVAVLSQAGMLLVHRLTERRDRERVEQAASELTVAATRQLPALIPGEALIVGSDFAVPVPVRIRRPDRPPSSTGPTF